MRINDISPTTMIKQYGKASAASPTHSVQEGHDKLVLSPEARGFMDALKAAREADSVNMQKVEELSDKIRKGAYAVSSRVLADKIMKE